MSSMHSSMFYKEKPRQDQLDENSVPRQYAGHNSMPPCGQILCKNQGIGMASFNQGFTPNVRNSSVNSCFFTGFSR